MQTESRLRDFGEFVNELQVSVTQFNVDVVNFTFDLGLATKTYQRCIDDRDSCILYSFSSRFSLRNETRLKGCARFQQNEGIRNKKSREAKLFQNMDAE
jgi:hypothetical protein